MKRLESTKGWPVVLAVTGINLALGILYTWGIFKSAILKYIEAGGAGAFNWELAQVNDPCAVCYIVFALSMIAAGRIVPAIYQPGSAGAIP